MNALVGRSQAIHGSSRHLLALPKLAVLVSGDAVDPLATLRLVRDDGQAKFFLKAPAKVPRTVCACQPVAVQIWPMFAPSGRCSIRITSACLLFSRVRADHVASAAVTAASSSGSLAAAGAPSALAMIRSRLASKLTDALPVHVGTRNAQGVVALRSDKPVGAVGGDQCAVEKSVEHLLACAAFDVVGNQSILPLVCSTAWARIACWAGSVGGGHVLLLRCGGR